MLRDLSNELISWKNRKLHHPLLIRGARQVGKTYLIRQFASEHFNHLYEINFELQPDLKKSFENLDATEIVRSLSALQTTPITPGNTLLFLDEIQECPNAIMALRYFREQLPDLHVIGAGSLLEFALNDDNFRMPVGRVQFLFLQPLSFREFLRAYGYDELDTIINELSLQSDTPAVIHEKLLNLCREYYVLGGMPAVHEEYLDSKQLDRCQAIQNIILNTYRRDFGKYSSTKLHKYLEAVFMTSPSLIGKQIKYVDISHDMRSRDIKYAFEMLEQAGLMKRVFASQASGLPLNAQINPKKFKLVLLDIGLMNRSTQININTLLREDLITLNRGAISEQFVGQELMAYSAFDEEPALFYWVNDKPSSNAEVDYITHVDGNLIPLEVKAGPTGRLKSLQQFIEMKNAKLGIQVSSNPLARKNNIINIPPYLMSEYRRIIQENI